MFYCVEVQEDWVLKVLVKERLLLHLRLAQHLQKRWLHWVLRMLKLILQGPGSGRDSVVRALQSSGLNITVLRDVTPLPHNGMSSS